GGNLAGTKIFELLRLGRVVAVAVDDHGASLMVLDAGSRSGMRRRADRRVGATFVKQDCARGREQVGKAAQGAGLMSLPLARICPCGQTYPPTRDIVGKAPGARRARYSF